MDEECLEMGVGNMGSGGEGSKCATDRSKEIQFVGYGRTSQTRSFLGPPYTFELCI